MSLSQDQHPITASKSFNRVVLDLENALLPELEELRFRMKDDSRFTEANVVSLRHAEVVHTVGLRCHPVFAPSIEDSFSVGVTVVGVAGIGVNGSVVWSQPFTINRLAAYVIHEAMTDNYRLESDDGLNGFYAELPALLKGFERGVRRGRPPGMLRRFWNRAVLGFHDGTLSLSQVLRGS